MWTSSNILKTELGSGKWIGRVVGIGGRGGLLKILEASCIILELFVWLCSRLGRTDVWSIGVLYGD